jgi:uncharacterized iron-regulated protein
VKRFIAVLITVFLSFCPARVTGSAFAGYSDRILQSHDGKILGFGQIISDLKGVSIIFVGEQHSDIRHHDLQLRVLRTLYNLGIPVAVGLEMFTERDQVHLDSWIKGSLPEKDFSKAHDRNWGDTWQLYSPIYRYAREKGIPMLGLNVPEDITTQVANQGFSSLSPEQRAQLPMVSCDIDEKYKSFIKMALSVHESSKNNSSRFESFCEAQLIWDTAMAYRLVRYIEGNPSVTVVVIAGNSHSWRPGIPDQLSRFSEGVDYRIILPEVPPVQTRHSIDSYMADYLWLLK